ncbi:MAG: choice-of-anchor N protein, partial [Myxococcota bacterium]
SDNPLNLLAFANATAVDGGNGDYPWSVTGTSQIAYLVISAVPKNPATEPPSLFDVTVDNDAGTLSLYTSGNGAPPLSDPNDLAPHGIFDTYFEVYEFNFDGALGGIYNTQTGVDPAQGYTELFDITINSLDPSVEALHFDLFTIVGSGQLGPTDQVFANAPFTHDAQTIPEPGAVLLIGVGIGLVALASLRTRTH